VLLEYVNSELFQYPVHSSELFQQIQFHFKQRVGESLANLQSLNILPILKELSEKNAIQIKKYAVGTKMADFILNINKEKLKQLTREYDKDRPQKIAMSANSAKNSEAFPGGLLLTEKAGLMLQGGFFGMAGRLSPTSGLQGMQGSKQEQENLLLQKTGFQKELMKLSKQQSLLINRISAAEQAALLQFRKQDHRKIDYCDNGTREKCR